MKQYLVISSVVTQQQTLKNAKVVPWTELGLASINLYDYDGILIDASSIPEMEFIIDTEKGKQRPNFGSFESRIFTPGIIHRILFNSDAFVVLLGDPSTRLQQFTVADRLGLSLVMTPSHGTNLVNRCEKHQPFFSYIKQIKSYTYAFRNNPRMSSACAHAISYFGDPPLLSVEPLLSIKVGDSIAARISGPGFSRLYLLPVLPSGVSKSVEQIFDILIDDEDNIISEPSWAYDIKVAGQKEIDDRIASIEQSITKLNNEKSGLLVERSKVRQPVEILYKTGKDLEASIKTALRGAGISVVDPPTTEGREFTFEFGEQKFVVEVKSTEHQFFDKNGLRQVIEWQDDVLLESGEKYKPVLIVSNEVKKPVQDRQNDYLPANLLQFAQERKIAVISVTVLFDAIEKIKLGIIKVDKLIAALSEAEGTIALDDIAP